MTLVVVHWYRWPCWQEFWSFPFCFVLLLCFLSRRPCPPILITFFRALDSAKLSVILSFILVLSFWGGFFPPLPYCCRWWEPLFCFCVRFCIPFLGLIARSSSEAMLHHSKYRFNIRFCVVLGMFPGMFFYTRSPNISKFSISMIFIICIVATYLLFSFRSGTGSLIDPTTNLMPSNTCWEGLLVALFSLSQPLQVL